MNGLPEISPAPEIGSTACALFENIDVLPVQQRLVLR
jgi:hypothetical protein